MSLLWLALLPWLAAPMVLGLKGRRRAAVVAGGVALAGVALLLTLAPAVFAGQVLVWRVEWVAQLGLGFGFRLDGLAWLLAFMITGIGALVVLYGAWYLDPKDPTPRFFAFLLLFMGAMLGVVMADNLVLLVMFWELTSLSSFLLIGYWSHRQDAREGARMALTITGAGGLCLFAGVLLIGQIVGSYQLDVVLGARAVLQAHALFPLALVLVLLGAFTKSAQFPFHFWLPHAMAAPTPVSAYLHSATMVKAGVFLLARFYPLLGGNEWWFWIVSSVGLITLLLGAYVALFQHDLKGLLAYSTISHLGLITLLFGLDEPLAVVAGVFHIINHATFKAGLFMSAGIIDHETGTRDMRKLAGLMRTMPATATLGMLAAASMAGVPLFNGFLSKEMFFAETLAKDGYAWMQWLLPAGATLAGVFSVAYSLRFIHDTFFNGEPKDLPKTPHEAPFFMLLPVGLLVLLCMVVGVLPDVVVGPLLAVAAQAALQAPLPTYSLAVWHGFNLPLAMSVAAVAGGTVVYSALHSRVNLHSLSMVPGWVFAGGRDVFLALSQLGVAAAQGLTGWLQNGSLQRYLLVLVVLALAAGVSPFLGDGPSSQMASLHLNDINWGVGVMGLLGIAATLATTCVHRQRLLALVLLGATGLAVCLTFAYFSAPDLALTQLLVELATVMLMMLALHWLPAESPAPSNRLRAFRDVAIAIAVGLGVAALVWMVLTRPGQSISDYFLSTTLALGGGANAVNVIIVDYRGFDTLGEITVLGISALILHALLANFNTAPAARSGTDDHPLMLQLVARLVLPFTVLVAVFFYLRGHNLPGGGFIGGLVLAIGLLLQAVAHGQSWVAQRTSLDYRAWVGWGLVVAVLSGLASWWFGAPFLTSTYDYPWLPGIGGVPLASASLFDAGVFLVVVGATMVMLLSIARLTRKAGH
jgi:multicomponent K+:H+ antiporter subunit A